MKIIPRFFPNAILTTAISTSRPAGQFMRPGIQATSSSTLYPYIRRSALLLAVAWVAVLLLWSAPVHAQQTPTITVNLGAPAKGSITARLAKLSALAAGDDAPPTPGLLQPQSRNGVFDEVNLGYLNANAIPAPATVTIQFGAALAGASVWVQPLDGGTILAQDTDGNPVSSPAGCAIVLDGSGQLVFSYQTLTLAGRYQVLIRAGNSSSILPFVLMDPNQDN